MVCVANMSNMSGDLIWEITKNTSCFVRKPRRKNQGMPVFNSEAGNLMGLNSYKYSGLGGKVLNVKSVTNGSKEKIILVTSNKKASRARRPAAMYVETGLSKKGGDASAALDKTISAGFYRRDLLELAKAKYAKLKTSFKKKKLVVKSRRVAK